MKEKLQSLINVIPFLWGAVSVVFLILALIQGLEWFKSFAFPIMITAFWACLGLFPLFLIFALVKPMRVVGAFGMMFISWAFGAIAWAYSLIGVWSVWGMVLVIIGLVFAWVGLVPMALIASLFNGMWTNLLILAVLIVLWLTPRIISAYAINKLDAEDSAAVVGNE